MATKKAGGPLRSDLQRKWVELEAAPDLAVFIDKRGHAWQKSAYLGFWYRAFEGVGTDSFTLAQNADGGQFIWPLTEAQSR